jgi:hypothetical protein
LNDEFSSLSGSMLQNTFEPRPKGPNWACSAERYMNIKNAILVAVAIAAFVAAIVIGFASKPAETIYWASHRNVQSAR